MTRRRRIPTEEELAAMAPSTRRRALQGRSIPIMTAKGIAHVGRPTKLTPKLLEEFVTLLASGAPLERVANAVGISDSTVREWMKRGSSAEDAGTVFESFALAVTRARARWWTSTYAAISSGRKGWQGRAWLAERLDPALLGPPPKRLEHSGPGGGGIRIIPMTVELPEQIEDDDPRAQVVPVLAESSTSSSARANASSGAASNGRSRLQLPEQDEE